MPGKSKKIELTIVPFKRKVKKNSPAAKAHRAVRLKSISHLKKKVWAVFSKWIRERDNYTCYTCGKTADGISKSSMHAGHFISRKANNTFFDEMNVHAQCMYCNMWNYGNVGPYAERLMKDYGLKAFKDLIQRSKVSKQWERKELELLMEKYKTPAKPEIAGRIENNN